LFFPTTYCNFKCVYCAHSLGLDAMKKTYDFVPENMSMETYGKFIHQMKKFPDKLKMLCLMGQGEPLINKDIPVMVKMAKDAEIAERVEIISNGSLLDKTMSDRLIEAGLDTLRISLQGLNSKNIKTYAALILISMILWTIYDIFMHIKTTQIYL